MFVVCIIQVVKFNMHKIPDTQVLDCCLLVGAGRMTVRGAGAPQ